VDQYGPVPRYVLERPAAPGSERDDFMELEQALAAVDLDQV
jgi:hypothetical protein